MSDPRHQTVPVIPSDAVLDEGTDSAFLRTTLSPPKSANGEIWGVPKVRYWTTLLCSLAFATNAFGAEILQAPTIRLFESILCRRYYETRQPGLIQHGDVPEQDCKVVWVQDQIALLDGWQMLFDSLVGLLVAMPFAMLADKFGRKWILLVSMLGLVMGQGVTLLVCFLEVDLRFTWMSSLCLLVGGGMEMAGCLYLMLLAAVTPDASRTTVFWVTEAINLSTGFFGPALGSLLLNYGPWIPVTVGFFIRLIGSLMVLAVPNVPSEGRQPSQIHKFSSDEPNGAPKGSRLYKQFPALRRFVESIKFMTTSKGLAFLILTFLLSGATRTWIQYFLQYVSKKYKWTLAQAGYLLSLRAGFKVAFLLFGLPTLSVYLMRRLNSNVIKKDLYISRASSTITCIGFFAIAVAPSSPLVVIGLICYSLGIGFRAATRSLLTSATPPKHLTQLYTATAIMDMSGSLLSGPILATAFRFGLKLGDAWLGLPFLWTAVLFTLISAITWSVNAPDNSSIETGEPGERDSLVHGRVENSHGVDDRVDDNGSDL